MYNLISKLLSQNKNVNFYFLLLATFLLVIFFSYPFLKYPYDMWVHLIRIDNVYNVNKTVVLRKFWYLFWAEIFHYFSVYDFFLRSRIIHVVQTVVCFFSIFVFSRVLIRNMFKRIDKLLLNYLSYWATITWLTIFATFSMYTHQVWIMWYSVNYQITLAFFWYITALTLIIVFEKKWLLIKLFYGVQIIFFLWVILSIHPMELIYYFMYLFVLLVVFFDRVMSFIKQKYRIVFPVFFLLGFLLYVFFSYFYQYSERIPKLYLFIKNGEFDKLYESIMSSGQILLEGHNRAFASINELMVVVFFAGLIMLVVDIRRQISHRENKSDFRLFVFIIISSLFVLIPLNQFSAGVAANIFHLNVVNRVYYSSSLFVILPISIYYFWSAYGEKVSISRINFSFISIILLTLLFSRFVSDSNNYYKNVKSLVYSFDKHKVGFNLSQDNITTVGEMLVEYEKNIPIDEKKVIYFARPDISLILKYVYKRDVYMDFPWNGKKHRRTFKKFEGYAKNKKILKRRYPVNFVTPDDFPEYVAYK